MNRDDGHLTPLDRDAGATSVQTDRSLSGHYGQVQSAGASTFGEAVGAFGTTFAFTPFLPPPLRIASAAGAGAGGTSLVQGLSKAEERREAEARRTARAVAEELERRRGGDVTAVARKQAAAALLASRIGGVRQDL